MNSEDIGYRDHGVGYLDPDRYDPRIPHEEVEEDYDEFIEPWYLETSKEDTE